MVKKTACFFNQTGLRNEASIVETANVVEDAICLMCLTSAGHSRFAWAVHVALSEGMAADKVDSKSAPDNWSLQQLADFGAAANRFRDGIPTKFLYAISMCHFPEPSCNDLRAFKLVCCLPKRVKTTTPGSVASHSSGILCGLPGMFRA